MNVHVVPNELYLNFGISEGFYFTFFNVSPAFHDFNRVFILINFEKYSNSFLHIHWAIRKKQSIQKRALVHCKTIIFMKTRKKKEQNIFSLYKLTKGLCDFIVSKLSIDC